MFLSADPYFEVGLWSSLQKSMEHGTASRVKGAGVGYMFFEGDRSRLAARDAVIRDGNDVLISDLDSKKYEVNLF